MARVLSIGSSVFSMPSPIERLFHLAASLDPRGLHQTLKTEEVYWRLYDNPGHCRDSLAAFQERHNTLRPHWALRPAPGADPLTAHEVYAGSGEIIIPRWQHWARAAKQRLDDMLVADVSSLAA
jgi:transposase InsO family protein